MIKNILLVGCTYAGSAISDTKIDVLGLCRPQIASDRAAFALYEYDVIIINPASYSHFLFGTASTHSLSLNELHDLKVENNNYDLDNAFDYGDRCKELAAAIQHGTRVIWLLAPQKRIKFFSLRSVYLGYVKNRVKKK